ncbi:MAG TPA: hypothetical protein IAC02_02460 [Candidatus Coprovivens excrementavium]|nr:hypothetical protein [Candidatus Coprovivens excrementavium]
MYIYITKDNYTSDVAAISFPVFVSEIDKDLDPSISVHYIGKIEQLIEDMRKEIDDKKRELLDEIMSNTDVGNINKYHQEFTDVMKELSEEKDYHSLPEIAGARGGFETLGERLKDTDTQLSQTEQAFNDAVSKVTTDSEVILARGNKTTLGERMDIMSKSLDRIPKSVDKLYNTLYEGIRNENGRQLHYSSASSTFSGWGSTVGRQQNFNAVTLSLYAFEETLIPENMRVILRYDGYQGDIIADVSIGIELNYREWKEITVNLNTTIDNPTGRVIWLEYHTDGRVANHTTSPISDVPLSLWYSTRASLTDLTMVKNYSAPTRHMWVATRHFSEDLSEEFIQQIAGNIPINDMLADNSIGIEKLSFTEFGSSNRFDKRKVETGGLNTDGSVNSGSTSFFTSGYINVNSGDTVNTSHNLQSYAVYNSSGEVVHYVGSFGGKSFEVPNEGRLVRVCTMNVYLDTFMLSINEGIPAYYTDYIITLEEKYIPQLTGTKIKRGTLPAEAIKGISPNKNLFNKETVTKGYYIDPANGLILGNPNYFYSDFIPVEPGETYSFNYYRFILFYDKFHNYHSGLNSMDGIFSSIIIPDGVHYVVFSNALSTLDTFQVEKGSKTTPYEPYAFTLKDLHIHKSNIIGGVEEEEVNFIDYDSFNASFEEKLLTDTRVTTPTGTWSYNTSVFSGWGTALLPMPTMVEGIRFKFRNRDIPSSSVLLSITKKDKMGEVLATKEINLDTQPFEEVEIEWVLDTPIDNSANEYLYFTYQSDQLTDTYMYNGSVTDGTEYGLAAYATKGTQNGSKALQDVYSSGDIPTSKVYLAFEEFQVLGKYYAPTDTFKEALDLEIQSSDETLRVVLPDEITAVVGDTLQLFYRGIVEAVDPYIYDIRVTCPKGKQFPRYFEFNPTTADVGNHRLTIEVRDNSGNILGSDATNLKVVNTSSPSTPKNILAIGDSLTSAGVWVQEARRRLMTSGGTPAGNNLTNFNFIGTKTNGATGWEGTGGWTWDSYLAKPSPTTSDIYLYVSSHDKGNIDQKSLWKDSADNTWELETIEPTRLKFNRVEGNTSTPPSGAGTFTHLSNATNTSNITYTDLQFADGNPFWDATLGRVSFKSYCERNGFSGIDYFYPLLTWNGGRVDKATIEDNASFVSSAKQLIDILHSEYPNAKVGLMGIQLPSLNGGTGYSYGANGGYSHAYGLVRGVFGLNLAYQEFANRVEYKGFVKFINVSSQFDSENLMPEIDKPVNTRSSKIEKLGTNGVHPSNEGYYAIGDVAYRGILGHINI